MQILESTYRIGIDRGQRYIYCRVCKRLSYNPEHIRHRYCAICKRIHPQIPKEAK